MFIKRLSVEYHFMVDRCHSVSSPFQASVKSISDWLCMALSSLILPHSVSVRDGCLLGVIVLFIIFLSPVLSDVMKVNQGTNQATETQNWEGEWVFMGEERRKNKESYDSEGVGGWGWKQKDDGDEL